MEENKASKLDAPLRTMADIQLTLKEARHQAENGDISGVDERVQQIKRVMQGQDAADAALTDDMAQVQNLWLETLADLAPVFETQGAYREALAYTRILHGDNPSWESDLRRLTHLYVLSGSRAHALAALQRRFEAAVQGQGSLALIRGVAGIGKTSLAQVCAGWARRQDAIFAMGRCYERGVTSPFSPWQEVLTSLAEATGTTLDTVPAPFGNGPPAQSAEGLVQTVATHLRQLVSEGPLVLLLDDLHWADRDTLDLLEFVTRRIESLSLLILVTYRAEEIPQNHPLFPFLPTLQRDRPAETISLTALELDDTTRLIESHLGPCSPGLARYLHDRAEGHPLFLIELLNDLEEQNLLAQDIHGRWLPPAQDVPVPTLLRQVIAHRVARLEHQGELLLDAAAVTGETWELPVVEAVLNWPEESLLAALEGALVARLVELDDERRERYCFSHGLIQEVLYQRQLPRRRRNLHGQIAGLLEVQLQQAGANEADRSEIVGALAYHAYRAEQWPQAFAYSQQAGDAAHRRHALHSVVHFYRQALDAARQQGDAIAPDRLLNLYEKLGEAHYLLYQKEEAVDIYSQMVETARAAKDKTAEVHALFRLALAQERMYYDLDRSAQTRQAALELAKEIAEPSLLALNHLNLGQHYTRTGDLDQAQHHLVETEQHARASDNSQMLVESLRYQGYLAIWWGEYAKAERLALDIFERVQAMSNVPMLVNACWLLGFALTEQGHYERARRFLLEGLEHVDVIGERHYYLNRLRNTLSYLHRELGDFETAMRWSQRALAENRQGDDFYSYECACYSLLDLATNELEAGHPEAAVDYFREFEANFGWTDYAAFRYGNRGQLLRTELALVQEAHARALEYATEAAELAQAKTMRKNMVKSLLYRGQALLGLERLEEAVTPLQQAVALADQIGHVALRWKTRLRLAEAHALLDRPNEELYREALAMVEAIAANLNDPQLHSSFLNLPLVVALQTKAQPTPEKPKTQQYPAGLSPREVEVLRLVAQGFTDRQISEKLHITVRTVNTHVTNILNKTACENRTAAATFAAQNNLV